MIPTMTPPMGTGAVPVGSISSTVPTERRLWGPPVGLGSAPHGRAGAEEGRFMLSPAVAHVRRCACGATRS
eukprot:15433739-Alexandrium_andersonii.AAC.1